MEAYLNKQLLTRALRKAARGSLLLSAALASHPCRPQTGRSHPASKPRLATPQPAIPTLLQAFQTFDVVAMPAAHGEKDIDDLILSLLRDPRLPASVNDVVVECGNVRLQPVLDSYIAGDNVPFTEVQHVWRDTTVLQMCGSSGFYEQLFPLVRALNQGLPAPKRLRVVAADPPIDWRRISSYDDLKPFFDRDGSIASVMEREVLSRHRKALLLCGIFHLLHGGGPGEGDAVTRYERHYPGRTFVISELGDFDSSSLPLDAWEASGAVWPSLLGTSDSRLGALPLNRFLQSPLFVDSNCNVTDAFASTPGRPVADQIDAFLYLGPQRSQLMEPLPADIALDRAYRSEWLRRLKLVGLPGPSTLEELDAQTVAGAADPLLPHGPAQPYSQGFKERLRHDCLNRKPPPAHQPNAEKHPSL